LSAWSLVTAWYWTMRELSMGPRQRQRAVVL
jgi:hypothetical protein